MTSDYEFRHQSTGRDVSVSTRGARRRVGVTESEGSGGVRMSVGGADGRFEMVPEVKEGQVMVGFTVHDRIPPKPSDSDTPARRQAPQVFAETSRPVLRCLTRSHLSSGSFPALSLLLPHHYITPLSYLS